MRCHPIINFGLASKIQHSSARVKQEAARFPPEAPHDSASNHAVLTSDPNKLIGQIEEHRRISVSLNH
jgi:hypothetical protein